MEQLATPSVGKYGEADKLSSHWAYHLEFILKHLHAPEICWPGDYFKTLWIRTYGHTSLSWRVEIYYNIFVMFKKELDYVMIREFCL